MIRRWMLSAAVAFSVITLRAQEETPAPEQPPVVQSSAVDEIKALVGKRATVEGKITRVGSTQAGNITFLNMGGHSGFVAVVFKASYEAFPEGLKKYEGQTVQITGPIALYKETTPQIVVKTPDQIKIVEAPEQTEGDGASKTE